MESTSLINVNSAGLKSQKMKLVKVVLIVSLVVLLIAVLAVVTFVSVTGGEDVEQDHEINAVVIFQSPSSKVTGTITLRQNNSNAPVEVNGTLEGLSPNALHGFHVHDYGDLRNGCISTGPHFNPQKKTHGSPSDKTRHVGDLGNVQTDAAGIARIKLVDGLIKLSGKNSVIGRAFVVHENEDDLGKGGDEGSLTTGNAGGRIACGIVGLVKPN